VADLPRPGTDRAGLPGHLGALLGQGRPRREGLAAIEAVAARVASPKSRLKTRVVAEQAATAALAAADATRWVGFTIDETVEETDRQEQRGRPGAATRYSRQTKTVFTIAPPSTPNRSPTTPRPTAASGWYPTPTSFTPTQVLAAYRYQPTTSSATTCSKDHSGSPRSS
jgi:hypothetical protein